jgi:hypothetical protein
MGPCDLPHMRYISFSYSDDITTRENNKMVRLIQSPGYRTLWGDRFTFAKTGERRLENNMTGFKLATSVGGVSTGERGDRSVPLAVAPEVFCVQDRVLLDGLKARPRTSLGWPLPSEWTDQRTPWAQQRLVPSRPRPR